MLLDLFKSHKNVLKNFFFFFLQIIGEISKKVAQIQNGKLASLFKVLDSHIHS